MHDSAVQLLPLYSVKNEDDYGRRRRLVAKNGDCRISHVNVNRLTRRLIADGFTTMMDVRWRFVLATFFLVFTGSWTAFAGIWWTICFVHGDFETSRPETQRPCVENVETFQACLLFSIETQHTIGYGTRSLTEECPEAVVLMMLQSILGVMLQCVLLGLVLAKIAKSKKRQKTLIFSSKAVITVRDNWYCLLFRVGDIRSSHIIQAHVRALCIKKRIFREGEVMLFHHYDVNVGFDTGMDRLFLTYPHTICHVINELSPFYDISIDDLKREHFEVVVILEGGVEHTGVSVQARTSYVASEIAWGFTFLDIAREEATPSYPNDALHVDYSRFHAIRHVTDMPRCSAKEYYARLRMAANQNGR